EKNTLQPTLRSTQIALENLTASESSIRDTDFAAETARMTRAQILQQAGTSTLAMANSTAQTVLNLLGWAGFRSTMAFDPRRRRRGSVFFGRRRVGFGRSAIGCGLRYIAEHERRNDRTVRLQDRRRAALACPASAALLDR